MAKHRSRDEDDQPQKPNPEGSVYEESGYPEEHSPRHGVGQRDDDDGAGASNSAAPAESADDEGGSGQEAGFRQRAEQQAYRRASAKPGDAAHNLAPGQ